MLMQVLLELRVFFKNGLNYKMKIPTNDELATYVGCVWNTTQANYDSNNPVSIN